MTKDDEDFGNEMAKTGVKPLEKRQQKLALRPPAPDVLNISVRRQAAASEAPMENNPDHYAGIAWLGPHDIVEYKGQGIQHDVFKNLKRGAYDVGALLDLHRHRVEEAKTALFQFIKDCREQDVRCAIILHGKGWHATAQSSNDREKQEGKLISRLKSYTVHWLKTMSSVQAFSSAQAKDGGTGALYVLIQKSEKAKASRRPIV